MCNLRGEVLLDLDIPGVQPQGGVRQDLGIAVLAGQRTYTLYLKSVQDLAGRSLDVESPRSPASNRPVLFLSRLDDAWMVHFGFRFLYASNHLDALRSSIFGYPDDTLGPLSADELSTMITNNFIDGLHAATLAQVNTGSRGYLQRRFKVRNPKFRTAVLEAYGAKCGMCEIGLGLVEAAHIDPVASPSSRDIISNGIALCPLHHASYDANLIRMAEDYQIEMDVKVADHSGLEILQSLTNSYLRLPTARSCWPDRRFIRNRERLFR